jgi:hypothetical protein
LELLLEELSHAEKTRAKESIAAMVTAERATILVTCTN